MYQAYKEIIKGKKIDFPDFGAFQKYHWELNETGMIKYHDHKYKYGKIKFKKQIIKHFNCI